MLGALLAAFSSSGAFAQIDWANAHKDRKITAVSIPPGRIDVNGTLDEPEWKQANPATDFTQTEPKAGELSTERTEVRLLYDDRNLYVGVYCFDSSGSKGLVVTDVNRDYVPFDNDVFSILLDTFDDDRNAFMFGTNPKGARREGQVGGDGAISNFDWDGIWYVKTRITEEGWQVEMAIPFKTLRFRQEEQQTWGVNFLRRIRRKNEDTHWSPIPRHYRLNRASLAGSLEGLGGVRQGRNLIAKPYLTAPLTRRQGDDVDLMPNVGLDVKYGLTQSLTLDLTGNTDFSQVEADEQQVNLTRFSLFFPEKRDFFLENSSIFAFGRSSRGGEGVTTRRDLLPFFSRRIGIDNGRVVPILGGARVSGRIGPYTVGGLSMQADQLGSLPSTNFSVARVRRDIWQSSDVGALFVDKQTDGGRFNRAYGVDTNLKFFSYLDISSFLMKTDTPGVSGRDRASDLSVAWRGRFYQMEGEFLSIGDNFNAEVGFVPRRGIRKGVLDASVTPRPGERIPWIREFKPSVSLEYIANTDNVLQTRLLSGELTVTFQNSSVLTVGRDGSFERLDQPFRIRPTQSISAGDHFFSEYFGSFTSDRRRMFSGNVKVTRGSFYDGDRDAFTWGLRVQPNYRLRAEVAWSRNDVRLPSGNFSTNLATARFNYSFTTTVFLKALIQYDSTLREISSNIRFNFLYRPLSDFFLVYNERRASTGAILERALIGKFTYAFSF